jgi:hypothetical protein
MQSIPTSGPGSLLQPTNGLIALCTSMSDRASVLCPTQDKLGYLEGVSVMYATVQTAIHTEILGPLPPILTACVQAFGEAGRAAKHGICHTNYSRWRKPLDAELSFGEYSLRLVTPGLM